jgi:menaquinone-specific isochorismate synthase
VRMLTSGEGSRVGPAAAPHADNSYSGPVTPAPGAPAELMVARTRLLPPSENQHELHTLLPTPDAVCSWVREGEGLVAWGEVARVHTTGASRFADAAAWWEDFCRHTEVHDDVGLAGSGLVAFTSLAFADNPGSSVLIVPRVIIGRRDGVTWMTEIGAGPADEPQPVTAPRRLRYSADSRPVTRWRAAVKGAVQRIRQGELDKVVLARDLVAESDEPIDPRFVLSHLAHRYPECWTFAVDGFVGATPELLVRRDGAEVCSRVLAGTTWPREGSTNAELAAELLSSAKDVGEHGYAVTSLVDSLRALCSPVQKQDVEVMQLRNVAHLSTTVTGQLRETSTSLLALAAALHPTAAVGGTPTAAAMKLIAELEDMDRGRYAGPVGWVNAAGDGELGLALRSAEINGKQARLFAGGGIVAESDPDDEVAETDAKFAAVRDALEGVDD